MSGVMMLLAACWGCGGMFSSNPSLVPSVRVKDGQLDPNGTREPLCRECVEKINAHRVSVGLEPFAIHPEAYEPEEVG